MTKDVPAARRGDRGKRAAAGGGGQPSPLITDPRFARVHTDPRFQRLPKEAGKVAIDERFKGV